jgi:hypothetical protein
MTVKALLSPSVEGPVTTRSVSVTVTGALAGANVQLYRNGVPAGNPEKVNYNGVASVTVTGLNLAAGDQLAATQSHDNVVSPPSPFLQTV